MNIQLPIRVADRSIPLRLLRSTRAAHAPESSRQVLDLGRLGGRFPQILMKWCGPKNWKSSGCPNGLAGVMALSPTLKR